MQWRLPTQVRPFGQLLDLNLVLLSQLVGRKLLLLLADMVGLKHGGENREAIAGIQSGIIAVRIDSCNSKGHMSSSPAVSLLRDQHERIV